MSISIEELGASLRRLHANGHPSGLDREHAEAFCRALARGTAPTDATVQVGFDRRIMRMIVSAGVSEVPTAISGLLSAMTEADSHRQILRSAATHPLVSGASVAVAGFVIFHVLRPVLIILPFGAGPTSSTPLVLALMFACGLLLAMALAIIGQVRVPRLARGWQRVDGLACLACIRVLVDLGAPLPRAVRAAALGLPGQAARRCESIAASLDAGADAPDAEPLLDRFEIALLWGAARYGTIPQSLATLHEHRRLTLEREIPEEAACIKAVAMTLAGLALMAVGVGFFQIYIAALSL